MFKLVKTLLASVFLVSIASLAQALTLTVNCDSKEGLTSIGAALKLVERLGVAEPNTLNVSGDCRENILVQNLDRLTLNAVNGASITDASGGTREVIDVDHSTGFTLQGFSIVATCPSGCTGGAGADAISCYQGADCLLIDNTISGAGGGAAIGVYAVSKAIVQGGTLQHNYDGLFTNDGAEIFAIGVTIQNNVNGVEMNHGGTVTVRVGLDNVTPSVIRNNTQQGIYAILGANVSVHAPVKIANNGASGIYLALGSKLFVGGGIGGSGGVTITGNAGSGVSVNDVSIAQFAGNAHVTGNVATNIACTAPTAVTMGAIGAAGGTPGLPYTNCSN